MKIKKVTTRWSPSESIVTVKTLVTHMAMVMVGMGAFGVCAQAALSTHQSDAQLNAIISQAVASHPLVGAAVADKIATEEGITAAKLNLLPTPSISAGYDANDDLVTQAVIRQPLWTGGRLTASVNQAIMDDKAAQESVYVSQNEVAKNTIDAWKSYITAAALQQLHLQNIDDMTRFEDMMKRRVAQGVSARIELELVRNHILLEQNAYQASKEQRRIAAARLEQIIGQPIAENALVIDNLAAAVQQVKGKSTMFEQMAFDDISYYNPTVVKAAFEIAAAQEEYTAQRANNYPSVYAQYQYSYDHGKRKDDSSLRLAMNYEPGAGFSNLALNRASKSRIDSLVKSQEAARRTVIENIQTQYQQFVGSKDQERSLIATVEGARMVVASNERLFKAGRKDWSDVLGSIRELNNNQQQLVQVRTDILAAFYNLQVEFGLMPWQQFQKNRLPTPAFSPLDEAKALFNQRRPTLTSNKTPYQTSTRVSSSQDVDSTSVEPQAYSMGKVKFYDTFDEMRSYEEPSAQSKELSAQDKKPLAQNKLNDAFMDEPKPTVSMTKSDSSDAPLPTNNQPTTDDGSTSFVTISENRTYIPLIDEQVHAQIDTQIPVSPASPILPNPEQLTSELKNEPPFAKQLPSIQAGQSMAEQMGDRDTKSAAHSIVIPTSKKPTVTTAQKMQTVTTPK